MSVRFKFKNDLEFAAIPCDGFNISVQDLKLSIVRLKRLGRTTNFDLDVINQQDNKPFDSEESLIPKNSTLIIVRRPLPQGHQKIWEAEKLPTGDGASEGAGITFTANKDGMSEDDKINNMISNSGDMYDQRHWLKFSRGGRNQGGRPPPHYKCVRCQNSGHWVNDCKVGRTAVPQMEVKKPTTGIPRSFLTPATKDTPGAKVNPQGMYMVNELEQKAYETKKIEKPIWGEEEAAGNVAAPVAVPEELICPVCKDLLRDCIMMPECACALCDECARTALIENETNSCPGCNTPGNSPDELIPWRQYRDKVNKFKNSQSGAGGSANAAKAEEVKPTLPDIFLPGHNNQTFNALAANPAEDVNDADSPVYGMDGPDSPNDGGSPLNLGFRTGGSNSNVPTPGISPNPYPDNNGDGPTAEPLYPGSRNSPGTPLASEANEPSSARSRSPEHRSPKRRRSRSGSPLPDSARSRAVPLPDTSLPPPGFPPIAGAGPPPPAHHAPRGYHRGEYRGGYRGEYRGHYRGDYRGGHYEHRGRSSRGYSGYHREERRIVEDPLAEFEKIMAAKDRQRGRETRYSPPPARSSHHGAPPPHSPSRYRSRSPPPPVVVKARTRSRTRSRTPTRRYPPPLSESPPRKGPMTPPGAPGAGGPAPVEPAAGTPPPPGEKKDERASRSPSKDKEPPRRSPSRSRSPGHRKPPQERTYDLLDPRHPDNRRRAEMAAAGVVDPAHHERYAPPPPLAPPHGHHPGEHYDSYRGGRGQHHYLPQPPPQHRPYYNEPPRHHEAPPLRHSSRSPPPKRRERSGSRARTPSLSPEPPIMSKRIAPPLRPEDEIRPRGLSRDPVYEDRYRKDWDRDHRSRELRSPRPRSRPRSRSKDRREAPPARSRSRDRREAPRSRSRDRRGTPPPRSRSRDRREAPPARSRSRDRRGAPPARSRSRDRRDAPPRSRSRDRRDAPPARSRSRDRDRGNARDKDLRGDRREPARDADRRDRRERVRSEERRSRGRDDKEKPSSRFVRDRDDRDRDHRRDRGRDEDEHHRAKRESTPIKQERREDTPEVKEKKIKKEKKKKAKKSKDDHSGDESDVGSKKKSSKKVAKKAVKVEVKEEALLPVKKKEEDVAPAAVKEEAAPLVKEEPKIDLTQEASSPSRGESKWEGAATDDENNANEEENDKDSEEEEGSAASDEESDSEEERKRKKRVKKEKKEKKEKKKRRKERKKMEKMRTELEELKKLAAAKKTASSSSSSSKKHDDSEDNDDDTASNASDQSDRKLSRSRDRSSRRRDDRSRDDRSRNVKAEMASFKITIDSRGGSSNKRRRGRGDKDSSPSPPPARRRLEQDKKQDDVNRGLLRLSGTKKPSIKDRLGPKPGLEEDSKASKKRGAKGRKDAKQDQAWTGDLRSKADELKGGGRNRERSPFGKRRTDDRNGRKGRSKSPAARREPSPSRRRIRRSSQSPSSPPPRKRTHSPVTAANNGDNSSKAREITSKTSRARDKMTPSSGDENEVDDEIVTKKKRRNARLALERSQSKFDEEANFEPDYEGDSD